MPVNLDRLYRDSDPAYRVFVRAVIDRTAQILHDVNGG